jgi:two-component system phosphate regulon sensor histidine kinase PhoR
MAGWVVAGILLIAMALLAWRWGAAHRQALQLRRELAAAQQDLVGARQAEQTLSDWQMSVGSAVEEALLTLDAGQHVVGANEKSVKLFGALIGKSLIEATRLYDLETLVSDALHSAEPMERLVTLNGSTYLARTALLAGGGLVLALQDVSEVQRLGRARRDFVANISHELRTPLASIRLLVETLQAGVISNAPVATDMLSKINIEVDALSQLARELLDLAMIESGQMPLKLQRTDLHELAEIQRQRFTPQAQQKRQTLDVDIPAGTCALADGEMISRVLSNLLHNACKFTPNGGCIRMSAQLDNDDVTVSVADTGPGIPPEDLARIFERFYKVDRARGQSGTGLGLAIARHIVEGHGGRIWAESSLGHGATFRFTLPVC